MNCRVISITTPKRLVLKGLWFGENKAKRAFVFIHGLTSSPFSHHELLLPLVKNDTAVIFFGNRGSELIAKFKKLDGRKKRGYRSEIVGEAHEVFTDCVDDIDGVVKFLKDNGVKEIYLVGHSTGCQKSVYYLSRPGTQKAIKGAVLLAPMSDYAYAKKFEKPEVLERAIKYAQKLIQNNKPYELLPSDIYEETIDAQRFISLNTPASLENQLFPYFEEKNRAKYLKSVRIPLLVMLGQKDEYRDRPISGIARWFEKKGRNRKFTVRIIKNSSHGFEPHEKDVAKEIDSWTKNL